MSKRGKRRAAKSSSSRHGLTAGQVLVLAPGVLSWPDVIVQVLDTKNLKRGLMLTLDFDHDATQLEASFVNGRLAGVYNRASGFYPFYARKFTPRKPDAPGQFAFADRDRVRNILASAGWRAASGG